MINARDHLIPYSFASVCFCSRIGLRPFLVSPVSGSAWKRLRWPWLQICAWMCTIHPFASNQTEASCRLHERRKGGGMVGQCGFHIHWCSDLIQWLATHSEWLITNVDGRKQPGNGLQKIKQKTFGHNNSFLLSMMAISKLQIRYFQIQHLHFTWVCIVLMAFHFTPYLWKHICTFHSLLCQNGLK